MAAAVVVAVMADVEAVVEAAVASQAPMLLPWVEDDVGRCRHTKQSNGQVRKTFRAANANRDSPHLHTLPTPHHQATRYRHFRHR